MKNSLACVNFKEKKIVSDPSLTIDNIAKSDEGIYVCRATNWFGTALSEDSVLTCKGQFL